MVYYRRRRLTMRRRPRRAIRRLTRRRIYRPRLKFNSRVHHYKRTLALDDIASSTIATFGAVSIDPSTLPGFTEFSTLYDQMRINKLVIKLVPNVNSANVGSVLPNFYSSLDYTDVIPPVSLNELFEYQNYRMTRGSQIHTRLFTPALIMSNDVGYPMSKFKQWFNLDGGSGYPSMYGLKWAADGTTTAGDVSWKPIITVYFSCKGVK